MASSNETISTIRLLSTAQRSLTPSKIPVRNSTPQRATSNPRNISAGKTRLAAALSETEVHRATSRSASRRKQRRWENQNIFSPEVNDILMQGLEDEENHVRIRKPLFKVEMRSAFRELFEPKNAAALETFRMCAESLVTQEKANQKHLSCGEKAWLRVEKRLRQILIESVGKNVDIIAFIADLEELITTYVKQEEIDESYEKRIDSKVLASLLIRVPSISPENELEVELKDSAFHRLLLHSVCQYHGLVSKSFPIEGKSSKVTIISKTKTTSNTTFEEKNCLTQFLYNKIVSNVDRKENFSVPADDLEADKSNALSIVVEDIANMKM